jgi:hypothetical protein
MPAGPPLVTPGERMSYKLALQGMALATYTIAVGDVQELDGKRVIVVQTHAKSTGLADLVAKVDDKFTSWIDVETGRPRRFQTEEYETNSKVNIEHVVIDLAGRSADVIPIEFNLNDGPQTPEPQKASSPEIWDYNAFLVALRAWEQPPGTAMSLEVFRSRFLWRVDIKVRGKDKLQTELGELPALRFDAHTYKLDRQGGKFPNTDERDFSVWISDDDGRVPLRTTAKTDYGDIKMDIVDYQPGTGQRLRR